MTFLKKLLILLLGISNILFAGDKNISNTKPLFKDFYKGELLSSVKQKYPSAVFLDKKEKNVILNLFRLNFLKQMNFFKVDKNTILVLNPKEGDRVVSVILISKSIEDMEDKIKEIVSKDKMLFKSAYVYYTNGIAYDKMSFKKESDLHNYLIDITTNLSTSKKGLLYLNENYENKNKKGIVFVKLETFKLEEGCKICAYLGNKNIQRGGMAAVMIYQRNQNKKRIKE